MVRRLDHESNWLFAPEGTTTCYGYDFLWTHRLCAPDHPGPIQALTSCGRRVRAMPASGPIDCPECLAD
jgi:hypothetical protein